jgi:hypothetical protein
MFVTGEIKGRNALLFRTEAVVNDPDQQNEYHVEWNYPFTVKDFMTDDMMILRLLVIHDDGSEEQVGLVDVPYLQFKDGSLSEPTGLGVIHHLNEACAARSHFLAHLVLRVDSMVEQARPGTAGKEGLAEIKEDQVPELKDEVVGVRLSQMEFMDPFAAAGLGAQPKLEKRSSRPVSRETRPSSGMSVPPEAALLQARLLPVNDQQKVEAAVHVVKNNSIRDVRVNENPYYHNLIASSADASGKEYQVAPEVGCVCKLLHSAHEDDEGEPVIVVPSLENCRLDGKFVLQILATEDITVERVN